MFNHLAGVTTAGAPDEIVDWFATFQAWMLGLGWTVAAGGGTTDVYFNSTGEPPGVPLTMLFIRVRRDPGNPNRVLIEVTDDIIPTHTTAEAGYLDGAGAQFPFWMSGDMDAIVICWRGGGVYNSIYAGMVMPFALTVPDETYRMIVTSIQTQGSILRDAGGIWDVDHPLFDNWLIDNCLIDRYDGSLPLGGTYFDQRLNIAGQLKHISCPIFDPAVTVMDVLTTGRAAATSEWLVVQDRIPNRFAMRTGGVLPAGMDDPGAFASVTGVAANYPVLYNTIAALLVGLGWTDLGDPGLGNMGRLLFSPGSSGEEEIYAGWANAAGPAGECIWGYVQDDALATHIYPGQAQAMCNLDFADFPVNYWISASQNCCVLVWQIAAGYTLIWTGLVPAFAPGLIAPYAGPCLSPYQLYSGYQGGGILAPTMGGLLLGHDGVWNQPAVFYCDEIPARPSNPSNFDGTTYMVWPFLVSEQIGADFEMIGQLSFCGDSDGGGIGNLDTITIAGQVYTVFFDVNLNSFCLRTT